MSVTEVNSVLGAAGVPLMDLLRAAVVVGKDIEATRFRVHPVSQLMRRFRKEVCVAVVVVWVMVWAHWAVVTREAVTSP